ncbi:MAG: deoxyhypusine synthase [Acidobacteriota bacterium]
MSKFLKNPVEPFEVNGKKKIDAILDDMGKTSFQGRNLSRAFRVWQNMLEEDAFIFFGLAGAMVPAGMRKIVSYLIENRMIDCIVSTGANLFHDTCETIGYRHYIGSPNADDLELLKHGVDRIYDTFASEKEFEKVDVYIYRFAESLDRSRVYTTREFLNLLGKELLKKFGNEGIVSTAARVGIPVYCPAIGDSSIGIALAAFDSGRDGFFKFDVVGDVRETAEIVMKNRTTGVIYISGGTPKNFIQQTEVTAPMIDKVKVGHKYAIQITADSPNWGGLSGCTFEEAQSWGKISKNAMMASVNCDSTIALPIIASALAARYGNRMKKRPLKKYPFNM